MDQLDDVQKKLRRFLDAQTAVFQSCRELTDWCKDSIEGQYNQANYEVAKHVFEDVVRFENAFDDFELDFWNYVEDVDGARNKVDNLVFDQGLADHKEYFFGRIEHCVGLLSEVFAEVAGAELEWPFLDELEYSLEALYDVAEDLIEADPSELKNQSISDLMGKIPPQRIAPLEVVATSTSICRKATTHLVTRVDKSVLREGAEALKDVLQDACLELERSNCDPRVRKAFSKCLNEISDDFELFSPVRFGIYVGVANSFKDLANEEFTAFLARQIISALMQCDIFLRNFSAWSDYSSDANKSTMPDGSEVLDEFRPTVDDPLFDDDVRLALDSLAEDKQDFGARGKVDYSIFQSISNAVSEVARLSLRFISSLPRSVGKLILETGRDGVKTGIGVLALHWVLQNSDLLMSFAARYSFFGWLQPVIEFVRSQVTG